jgi:hypothetical protein
LLSQSSTATLVEGVPETPFERSGARNLDLDCTVVTDTTEATMARGALLWLLGVPIPIIILFLLFWR